MAAKPSQPAFSTAFAIHVISVTFGVNLTKTGLFAIDFTHEVIRLFLMLSYQNLLDVSY